MTLMKITASIALLALAAAAAAPAYAQEARRAVRDKETGKFRTPSDEELAAERAERAAAGQPEAAGPVAPRRVRQHPNGMRSAVLGPEYMSTLKAERSADGKLVIKHANPAHEHRQAAPKQTPQRTTE
jgi:hypothetical protein